MQQQLGSRMEQKSTAPVPPQDVDIVVGDSASKIDASKAQRAVTLEPEETVRSTTVERRSVVRTLLSRDTDMLSRTVN